MKLYRGPHTCAIGTHILLEEIGALYETQRIDVVGGATHEAWFRAINPKGKVPALVRDDGSVLTEIGAIRTWLALTHPDKALLPDDAEERSRAGEIVDHVVGTIHGQGFGRILLPRRFEPQAPMHQAVGLGRASVRKQGRDMVDEGFAILDRGLAGREWAAGDRFSVADAAPFYVERRAPQHDVVLPPNVRAHFERVGARPAVRRGLAEWGEPGA